MSLQILIEKSDTFKTAIESLEELINHHNQEVLKPTLTYLKEEKIKVAKEIAKLNIGFEKLSEKEINHLSSI